MGLFTSTSFVVAFIAGIAALFAPCCITVLLPSYFASVFRSRRKIFLMTFVFFLGIATVFLPMGLGFAALGQFLSRYHNTIFAVGGIVLILFGLILLSGKHIRLPWNMHPALKGKGVFSIYSLGIFSGLATTCCAPVLAGVLTLAALPGSVMWGELYTLSYVLGMVVPLFFVALFLDAIHFNEKFLVLQKPFVFKIGKKNAAVTLAEFVPGIIFLAMGILIAASAFSNRLFVHSTTQININIFFAQFSLLISNTFQRIPNFLWGVLIVLVLVWIIKYAVYQLKNEKNI